MKNLKVLVVEDSEDDSILLLRHLKNAGYAVEYQRVETADTMEKALLSEDWEIILSDYSMPKFDGLGALSILKQSKLDIPFIIISGTMGEDTAVQAMLAGVDDYFVKGNLHRLVPAIERELEEAANRRARRQAEVDLEENKKRLQLALVAAGLGVWEWNLQTDAVYWSPECFQMMGVEGFNGQLTGFTSLIHPEDVELVLNAARDAVENQRNFVAEFRVITPGGKMRWLANYGLAEYDASGLPLRLIGTVQNITERKQAEFALRESEENFRALVQASTQFVWTADSTGASDDLFEWFSELSGKPVTTAQDIIKLMHPEDLEPSRQAWQESFENRSPYNFVNRFLTKKDEYCYLATRSVPIFDRDGSFRQWIGTFNDITERMEVEESLRKNEALLQLISDIVPTIIVYYNAALECVFVNEAFLAFVGKEKEEVLGKNVREIFNEDVYLSVLPEFERALTGQAMTFERTAFQANSLYMRFNYVPDFDAKENVQGFFVFIIDLSENKRAEERLRKSEEQLLQAQKLESVGRLAGGIAHDFNNMLTAINGYSDLTLRRLEEDNPLRRNIEEIKKAGERSAALTQQLLAFSRRAILQVKTLKINQIISDSIVMLQRLIGEDIQIVSNLDQEIDFVKADPGQLSQTLMNLVVNARDAMPQGGTITIQTNNVYLDEEFISQHADAHQGEYVRLSVSDNGTGMDEETQQHIFEPFFTTKAVGQGTGLGLSTVYGIVSQLNGYIWVESEIDVGTVFEIYWPSLKEAENGIEVEPPEQEYATGTETILLVEDEELVRKLSRQILESSGYKVFEAINGAEAFAFCQENAEQIDLLMTDVIMPKMSGRELAEKLLIMRPQIKVLFTSGYTDDAIVKHGVTKAEMNFIKKPFTFDELARKVRSILDNKP